MSVNPSTRKVKAYGQEFNVITGYIVSLRLSQNKLDPVSRKQQSTHTHKTPQDWKAVFQTWGAVTLKIRTLKNWSG